MADKKDGDLSEYEKIRGQNDRGMDLRYEALRGYLATTAFTDSCVGVVMDALNKSPFRENTIVVLWSDHGWHLGEKLHYNKFTHWDQALRTLLVIDAPGRESGSSERVVNSIDIFPTLVELCGLPGGYLQEGFDRQGHSLLPLLEDGDTPWNTPSVTVNLKRYHPMTSRRRGETYSDEFWSRSVRTERWKLIEYADLDDKPSSREYELYDLEEDPEEWNNLAGKAVWSEIQSAMTTLLHQQAGGINGPQKENLPPVVVFNAPLPGLEISAGESIQVEAGVWDMDGPMEIGKVIFTLNGVVLGEDDTWPYTWGFEMPEGECRIGLEAIDKQGLSTMTERIL